MAKQVGIRFSDNDFGTVVTAFLRLLVDYSRWPPDRGVVETKSQVVELFRLSAPGLYWLTQNRLQHPAGDHIATYLVIEERDVFFDDEVAAYAREQVANFNGDFHAIDVRDPFVGPYVYSL